MAWLAALLGVCLLALRPAGGVQYVNDELLWTKQSWEDYKLPFPWQAFSKREQPVARLLEAEPWVKTSLSGPLGDIRGEIERATRKGADLQPSRFDVSLLDESSSREAAAGVAQCKVCMALASKLWAGLTQWVNTQEAVPSKKKVAEYAQELCEYEVPNEVLREWVLLRAKVQPNQMAPFYIEGNQEFYMLSQRQKQHATPTEIASVRLACQKLIKDETAAAPKTDIVRHVSGLLHKYYDHLEQRLGKASQTGGAVEAVDDGPEVDQTCINRHPQCEKWAEQGECEANPTYMIGDDKQYIGQCNWACRDCEPEFVPQPDWNEADREHIASVSRDLLTVLHSRACASGPPCAGATGAGMEELLALAGGKAPESGAGQGPGFVSGPHVVGRQGQDGEEEDEEQQVDPARLQASKLVVTRDSTDTFVPHSPPKKPMSAAPTNLPSAAAKILWIAHGNKCLYVTTGWWMYELCGFDSITQFHLTESQQVDWVISLGKFESASWEPRNTTEAGLFPPGKQVPYVSQRFTHGNDCELTEDVPDGEEVIARVARRQEDGKAGGEGDVPVIRRTAELRIMCSPDAETRIFVLEPRQCRYLVELYVPQLCRLEGFQIEGHERRRGTVLQVKI